MEEASSRSSRSEVYIRVLGGPSVGKSVLIRHFMLGMYSDEYDPTDGSYRCQRTLRGMPVVLDVDEIPLPTASTTSAFVDQLIRKGIDAILTVVEPTRPSAVDGLEKVRFETLTAQFKERKAAGGFSEAVVVLWWEDERSEAGEDSEEWRAGLERGREIARRAGDIEVHVVQARSGEGATEAFEAVAVKVLEMREVEEAELARAAETRRNEEETRIRKANSARQRFLRFLGL